MSDLDQSADEGESLSPDERAAIRAYLQRSEVRLSTMHRVASALLSGAGLMVLLPAVAQDAVIQVLRSLVTGHVEASKVLMVVAVTAMLLLPFTALWLVLRDLIQFYFHSHHVHSAAGDVFTPRFTLTALRLPQDELSDLSSERLEVARHDTANVELLVPANDRSRRHIDQRIVAYGGLGVDLENLDDEARATALFVLAASRPRDLVSEVAKIEHGMARHVLRTQTIVLRYVKALLALLTTAMATYGTAAVVSGKARLGAGDLSWLAGIVLVWSPVAIVAVTSPVRWLEGLLRSEGATHPAVSDDPELTRVELVAIRLAVLGFAAALLAMIVELASGSMSVVMRWSTIAVAVAATSATYVILRRWARGTLLRRLIGRG